ncbi:Conserved_hypothetical protein [Hexamita inflata]|uniref:Myb-like domain-containing protein n=1 Tax=Hexamita inflata TaxID=28002 RepID=A0AA86UYG4_9EUKA|nr:Conserved hypothetical protein [Hexamita inflata]
MQYKTWNKNDKALFVELHRRYGIAFENYQQYFPNRTLKQIKSFYYNKTHLMKIANERSRPLISYTPRPIQTVTTELSEQTPQVETVFVNSLTANNSDDFIFSFIDF